MSGWLVVVQDPVRKEVPDAVLTCQKAGITVRMVTGDNVHTAQHIARECGILTETGVALEGPVFREMPEDELIKILPKLQVNTRFAFFGSSFFNPELHVHLVGPFLLKGVDHSTAETVPWQFCG